MVADAMYFLNHIAKTDSQKRYHIYHLKNKLMKLWYPRYCSHVSCQTQSQECWSCNGTGWYNLDEDECWKCGGTGIYRQHVLFRFVFDIAGKKYIWHQPAKSIDWLTAPEDWQQLTEFTPYESEPTEDNDVELCYVMVRQYLARNGVGDLMDLISFSDVLMWVPGRKSYRHWQWKQRNFFYGIKRLKHYAKTGETLVDYDDIPF